MASPKRDSFNRFSDDLSANIFSFMKREHQLNNIGVSWRWYNLMFTMTHIVSLNLPMMGEEERRKSADVRNNENKRVRKMHLILKEPSFDGLSQIIESAPNLAELRIEYDESYDFNAIFDEKDIDDLIMALKGSKITKLQLALPIRFKHAEIIHYFCEYFGHIITELWIDMRLNDKVLVTLLEQMRENMKSLKKLTIDFDGVQYLNVLPSLTKVCPQIETLIFYGAHQEFLLNFQFNAYLKSFQHLKVLLVQKTQFLYTKLTYSALKPLAKSTQKSEPMPKIPIHQDEVYFLYSKDYKFIIDTTKILIVTQMPKFVENFVCISFIRFGDKHKVSTEKLINILRKSNVKRMRVSPILIEDLIPEFVSMAKINPNSHYLLTNDCTHMLSYNKSVPNLKSTYQWN